MTQHNKSRSLSLVCSVSACAALLFALQPLRAAPQKKAPTRSTTQRNLKARKAPLRKAPLRKAPVRKAAPTRKPVPAPQARSRVIPHSLEERRLQAIEIVKQAAQAYERGDYRRTVALCETAADWYPTYARAHVWMGAAYQKLGNYAEARLAYNWAKALAPGTADAQRAERGLREIGAS